MRKSFDDVLCLIVQYKKVWLSLLLAKHVSDELKGVDNSRSLSVCHLCHLETNECIKFVIICNKNVFVAFRRAMWKFSGHVDLFYFLSVMAAQQKMILVTFTLSVLELVCTCNDFPHVVSFVVDNMLYSGCFVVPLIVVVEIGQCCWTTVAISPVYPVKWWLLIAVIHVEVGGEKRHWWKNLIKSCFFDKWVMLEIDSKSFGASNCSWNPSTYFIFGFSGWWKFQNIAIRWFSWY